MAAHAWLSASGSSQWLNCPRSALLSKNLDRRSSKWADEGTRAHAVAETIVNDGVVEATDETAVMVDAVYPYVDLVRKLMTQTALYRIEARVSLAKLWKGRPPTEMFGTVDFACVLPGGVLRIVDLKYGAGVPVEVRGNTQLLYYALGIYLELRDTVEIKTVSMTIVQPRAEHPDGPVRTWTIPLVDLLQWAYDVVAPTVEDIVTLQPHQLHIQEGSWCRWCPAGKSTCPIKNQSKADKAKEEFADGDG